MTDVLVKFFSYQVFQWFHTTFLVCLTVLATILLANLVRRTFRNFSERSSAQLRVNPQQYIFIKHLLTGSIYLCGISIAIYMIPPFRNLALSIFASSGILAAVIGFASQQSIANIVSGLFITIFKPFRVGDRIKMPARDVTGTVEDITLRHTVIKTFENKRVIVPNSVISTDLIENSNLVDERICKLIDIGISYDSDMDKAMEIIRDEAMKHPEMIDNRDAAERTKGSPAVVVRVTGFSDSAVNLRAWVWAVDQPAAFRMGCDLYKSIKQRFGKEGVEIPFPHRTIVYKNSPPPAG